MDVGAFFVGGLRGGYRRGKSFCAMLGDGLKNGFMNIFVLNWLFRKNLFSKKCKFDIYGVL